MKKFSAIAAVLALFFAVFSVTPATAATTYALGEVSCGNFNGSGWDYITEVTLSPGDTFTFRPDSGCFNTGNGSSYSDLEYSYSGPAGATVSSSYIVGSNTMIYNYQPATTVYSWGVAANSPYGVIDQYISVCNNCSAGRYFKVIVADPASLLARGKTAVNDKVPFVAPISVSGISIHKTTGCAGSPITITGDGVANSSVAVGGKPVKVISNTDGQVTFECPVLDVGSHNVTLTNSRGKLTFESAIQITPGANKFESVVSDLPNITSVRLSSAAQKSIKSLLAKYSAAKEITCTSSATNKSAAVAVCAYAKKLKPSLIISTRVMKTTPLSVSILFE